ncbi:hypothetical protein DERF_013487 [Dermatophagoides farinae]|uniref:Uncharacterized protein n=1 Tax=Dermatophagoides farinae TaxID=6954 RepID=A0A922HM68_DERFA|nr:hypothetical protein DERF_013487 [Dermatophagoides farinae]
MIFDTMNNLMITTTTIVHRLFLILLMDNAILCLLVVWMNWSVHFLVEILIGYKWQMTMTDRPAK